MAFVGIKKLIKEDKEETKRNTSAIIAEQIKAGLLAGLGKRSYPEDWQDTTTGRVTTPKTTTTTETAPKTNAGTKTKKTVTGTPRGTENIARTISPATAPVSPLTQRFSQESVAERLRKSSNTTTAEDPWVNWLIENGHIDRSGSVQGKVTGPISKEAYKELEQNMSDYKARNRIATDTGTAFGNVQRNSPLAQYNSLKPEDKASFYRAGSDKVRDITSFARAQQFVAGLDYNVSDAWQEMDKWDTALKNHKKAGQEQNKRRQDLENMLPEGVIRQRLAQGAKVPFTETPDNYNDFSEDYDRQLYDFFYGRGEHDKIMKQGSRQQKEQLMGDLRELWRNVDNGTFAAYDQQNRQITDNLLKEERANMLAEYAEDLKKQAENDYNTAKGYQAFMDPYREKYDGISGTAYAGQDLGRTSFNMHELERGVHTSDADRIYSFLTGGKEYQAYKSMYTNGNMQVTDEYDFAMLMKPEEQEIFKQIYTDPNGGKKAAEAFMAGLKSTGVLQQRYSEFEKIRAQEFGREFPVMSVAASLMNDTANTVITPFRTAAGLLGYEGVNNPNDFTYKPAMTSEYLQQGFTDNIRDKFGDTAAEAAGVALNTVQNVLRGLLTRGLGLADKAQEVASLALFGVDVFGKNTYKYLDKGYGLNESYMLGGIDSAIEVLEEKIPTDVMLGGVGKSFWTNLRNSAISEWIQEGVGATAGEKVKGVLTGEDSERKRAVELFAEGMTDENGKKIYPAQMGQEGINLVSGKARKEYVTDAARSAFAGLAGGGLGAAYGGIVNTANNINLGRAINSRANSVDGKTGAAQLAALAKESTDKEIREAGEKLDKKITGGKGNPSNYAVGKLAGMLYQGTAERMQTVVQDKMVRSIRDQIMTGAQEAATRAADAREAEQHEITQQEAQHYAEIIAKSVLTGKNPTNTELQELSKSEDAIQAWKSFNTRERVADMAAEIRKEAAPMNSVMDTLGDLTSKVAKSRSAAAPDIDAAIKEAGGDTAAAIDTLQARRSDLISESFAGKMKDILKSDKGGKQSKNFLDDSIRIMLAAKTMAKTAPKTRLDSETAQKLFDAAREEFEAEDANRVLKQETVKPGEGKASFEGVEYGTKEWKQKVSGLSKTQRNQMGALGEIASRAGLKVTFINDAKRSMINGYENNDGSIVINIAARNRSGLGHHMLTTMSHEMTHWLEQNSREGYAALRQFIVDGLRNSGTDVESRILQIMDNQNAVLSQYEGEESEPGLSVNGAMAELVAQGCENLLSSETMMQELAEVNPSAFSKVKTFVTNFVARIRNAVKGMSGSLSYEARTLIGQTEQIAKLWSSARAEALARNAEEGTEAQAGTQYSMQQTAEQAQEMDTEEYRQIAEQAGLDAPQMLRYSMVGPRAGGDYAEMIRQARQMEKQGEDAETIFRETGARKGFRGHWWVTLDNQNIRMKENFDTDSLSQYAYDLADVMDAEELMAAYPQLGKVKVQAQEMGRAYAAYVKDQNTIVLNEEELKRNPGKVNVALRHEIQHVIQDIEGANGGANMSRWQDIISRNNLKEDPLDLYWRTAGEMEANAASKDGGTMPTREQYDRAVAIEDYAPGLKGWKSRMEGRLNRHFSMADISAQDQEYAEAVASGNMQRATEMLMEKLKHSEDIIPYSAPHGYGGQHKTIARMIKEGTPEAVARAAQDLASYVPDNAVLVPMPPHEGTVTDDTDTMILARAISEMTGRPVVNALASNPRESRYQAKSQGRKGLTAEEMGFRKIAELPEGTIPIFVDNVVGSGETAKAANLAMGGGVTLAYAKGTRTQGIRGLKEANVTYDKDGNLIPLSQRFNPEIRNVKYSTAEVEEALAKDAELTVGPETHYGDHAKFSLRVTDPDELKFLNGQKTIKTYKSMQLVDGKLYPPMAAVVGKSWEDHSELGQWEKATEHPELVKFDDKGRAYFKLNKGKGQGVVDNVAYNPYEHSSNLMINDQFKGAHNRNLVTVECEVPASEENGEYHAQYAKDSTGWHSWHAGDVATELKKKKGIERQVFLSRWIKPVRIVPESEVAQHYKELIEGTNIQIDDRVVPKALREELEKAGVPIKVSGAVKYSTGEMTVEEYADGEGRTEVKQGEQPLNLMNDSGENVLTILPGNTVAATRYSLASYRDMDERGKMTKALKKAGYTQKEIDKWLKSLDNVANIIASNRAMYDFVADRSKKFLKDNGDVYKKTLDASTMCKKTRLYNGTFNVVQHMMPNTILMPEDLIDLFNIMKDLHLETPCGFCYVQSRRRQLGPYTEEWLKEYKGDYIPTVDEVTTSDGLEKLKVEHPQTYTDFVNAMNAKGVNNPKLVQQRTDYRGEIRDMRKSTIDYLNRIGGLRIQSFSDFEVVHMLDMMQAVMDMKARGLTSQAYTKVPEFAWIFGNTGIKINLSLVGKGTGLDANGKLVFDNDEGMPYAEAMRLRKAYSKNVGTILVGINDEHIIAAMGDDTIDFIIPFHKSGWSANELAHMRGLEHYSDYTESQNEYDIKGIDAAGNLIKVKADSNMDPLDYWEFDEDGEYNARKYLRLCKENHIVPKFAQFLTDNKDGSFSLPEGNDTKSVNIRKGYWKTLIDFKMYDNEGIGSRQEKVEPNFNMDEAMKILEQYDGSHRELPESWEAAEEFVKRYKAAHPLDNVRVRYSTQESFSVQSPYDMDVNNFMMGLQETSLDTLQEKTMLRQYKDLKTSLDVQRLKIDERTKELRNLEAKKDPNAKDRNDMIRLRNQLDTDTKKRDRLEEQIVKVTSSEGYAGLMYRQHRVMMDLANGKTADDVKRTISGIQSSIEGLDRQISEREAEIREMAESTPVKAIQAMINDKDLDRLAAYLRKTYNSKTSKQEIMQDMAAIRLKMANRQKVDDDIEALTRKLIGGVRGEGSVYLDLLRGMTITLSRDQVKELAGKDSGIAEVRRMLAGSGIKVKQGKAGGSLDANWNELCDMIPALDRDTNEKDQIDELIRFVQSQLQTTSGAAMYQDQLEDAMTEVRAITASVGMDMAQDPAAVRVVQRMMGLMAEMQRGMKGSAAELKKAREQLAEMSRQGAMAGRLSGDMEHNITSTIEYLNKLSEQSEAARWRKERVRLIEQLKSETTEKLLQEQAKWKARIEKDKTVRSMMNENLSLRKKINTNVNRVQKLLIHETDQRNVPEHLKGLARLMVMKVLSNDLGGGRKITGLYPETMAEMMRVLRLQEQRDGSFDFTDLDMVRDPEVRQVVADALADIEDGIAFYNARGGKDITANLQGMKNALTRISEAVSNITSIISAERHINFRDRQIAIEDAADDVMSGYKESRFKGEWKGFGSKAINAVKKSIGYGNMTPVYFMKNLRNRGMMDHWREMEHGEHKSGLLLAQAKAWMNQLAEKTHYKDWAEDKITVQAADRTMTMDVQSAMTILAIWKREHTGTNPENSSHIENGGVHIKEKDENKGRLQREKKLHKAIRLGESDIAAIRAALTDEQLEYMEKVVGYLSHEMSELGNETSMRMYGIKKFKEDYYFPMKTWSAQLSEKSDAGAGAGMDDNRAAHKSWSKRRTYYARTALEIGNFTEEAVRHITEMINYNTMAPVIENLNRTLNYQVEDEDGIKRNLWERFEEAYGKEARDYLKTLLKDMNGGAVQDQRKSLRDRALTMFKKNAVAGSLSVAAQQPLSYVRAAMMLSPRDMAQAIMPQYYRGSWAEMMKHSGVAVIKEMGRFDMNFGQSARDYVSPDTSESLPERVVDKLNILPELMDRMTWTRMWSACKIEQHRLHPEMDMQSDAFLDMVGERFNDVMRRTQVYDSVLVKSSNMRSQNLGMKVLTSFMAEPTVSLNVLEDAVRNARDKGGMKLVGKAVTTFALSAVLQALIKGIMGAGRSPDDKKTAEENFLYKWQTAFMSEANPLGLIPGYSDLIEVLKNGELTDDAMSAVGKLKTVIDKAGKAISGQGQGVYRDLEDTAGQLAQMFTNVPAKNIMRDLRAMLTWFRQGSLIGAKDFANRESSDAVKRMQAEAGMYQGDNLLGVINTWLGEAGYKTTNKAYYGRMYDAMQAGNDQEAADIREYLTLGKGVKEDDIDSGLRSQAKADSSLGEAERSEWLIDQGLMSGTNTITTQLKKGKISAEEARKLMKQADPEMSDDDIWWKVDQISWQLETGAEETRGKNYRLMQAVAGNKSEEINRVIKEMMAHGVTQKQIKDYMGDLKQEYLAADSKGKVRIRDAIQKVYKAIGLTAAEADKRIKKWK